MICIVSNLWGAVENGKLKCTEKKMDVQVFWNVIGNYNKQTWSIQITVFVLSCLFHAFGEFFSANGNAYYGLSCNHPEYSCLCRIQKEE